jgi:mannose-1-phosphate guanylyltransferase
MAEHAVIMAGGGGTRLWPISRRKRPKQSLRLFGDRTLFQMAVDRIAPMIPRERIWVMTAADQADDLMAQCPELPKENFLIEPAPRGTASVVGWAAIVLRRQDAECRMACLTADHYIGDVESFRRALQAAFALAAEGDLVTLGIKPTYPATGFGYIELGEARGDFAGYRARRAGAFREKPDRTTAENYLSSGRYAWNSGMFIWRADRILPEIERQMPDLYRGLTEIEGALGTPQERSTLERVWISLKKQTVDYGIMEGAKNVSVIPADELGWWDVGSWSGLFEILKPDRSGNLILGGNIRALETRRTLVYQEPGVGEGRLIVTLGVEGLVVVDAGDAVLVCRREEVESLRQLVEQMEREGDGRYL